jgi:hypothetical protein
MEDHDMPYTAGNSDSTAKLQELDKILDILICVSQPESLVTFLSL